LVLGGCVTPSEARPVERVELAAAVDRAVVAADVEPAEVDVELGEVEVAEPEPPAHRHADFDPSNDLEMGPPAPVEDCHAKLDALGVKYAAARIGVGRKVDGVYTCGAHQVVRYKKGPSKIAYNFTPLLTCSMAIALVDLEAIVQEEAEAAFGSRVVKIDQLGTYNCRKMVNFDLVSEHSFANAIDLRRFHLANGKSIVVEKHFRPGDEEPSSPESVFLRRLSNRLWDEGVFSVVVTPFFDRLHHNHIHVDLARYRVDGSRP
jgi:hypothetical protein